MHPDDFGSSGDPAGREPAGSDTRSADGDRTVPTDGPVRADVTTRVVAGVSLVRVVLRNDVNVALRVRVSNELDGPVLPPRREGVPAAGWDADGFAGTVPADGRLGIGYACPATSTARSNGGVETGDWAEVDDEGEPGDGTEDDDEGEYEDAAGGDDGSEGGGVEGDGSDTTSPDPLPVSVDCRGPADGDASPSESERVAAAVRSLGRATPPPDAVPAESAIPAGEAVTDRTERNGRTRDSAADSPAVADVPPPVESWLDGVETRVDDAEALTGATAADAADVLEARGGVEAVASLPESLASDLAALHAVADRIDDLAARAGATDPEPVISSLADAASDPGRAPATDEAEPNRVRTDASAAETEPAETAASRPPETR